MDTAHALQAAMEKGELSSEELTRRCITALEETEPTLHAFLHVARERALEQARAADGARRQGRKGALLGIPVALKDNMTVKGMPCTCGSRILENWMPPYDATVTTRLREAGAVILGKTNCDEFAMGSSTENSAYGPCANPWDTARVPGGSSGGSAVAVAVGSSVLALGSDTGGSVRQPAGLSGVCGMKPTYGRISRYGLVAYASSLDQIGPFARDTEDVASLLKVICGHDPLDTTSADVAVPDFSAALTEGVQGLRIGLPREYFATGLDAEVEAAVRSAARELESAGAVLVEVSLPNVKYALSAYYVLAPAEASSNLARYDGGRYGLRVVADDVVGMFKETRRQGFGAEVKRRIMIGTYALSAGYYDAYYKKAQQVRTLVRRDFDEAFQDVSVILCPTTPGPAFKLGEKTNDPVQMYLSDIYTVSVNLAGLPGYSIPCGFTSSNLPIGAQLLAPAFEESRLLQVAAEYQRRTDFHTRRPPITARV